MKLKSISIINVFCVMILFIQLLLPLSLSANQITNTDDNNKLLIEEVENSSVSTSKKQELETMINDTNEEIIEVSEFEKEGVVEYEQLTNAQKETMNKYLDELLNAITDKVKYDDNEIPYVVGDQIIDDNWKIYSLDNDIIVEFDNFKTYLIDNEYVNYIEQTPSSGERSYSYMYTSKVTNKEWLTALDYVSNGGLIISWKTKSAVAGAISGTASLFSFVGQRLYKTLYKKIRVYKSSTCQYKGKKLVDWYQFNTYSGRKMRSTQTFYWDNTNYYHPCY